MGKKRPYNTQCAPGALRAPALTLGTYSIIYPKRHPRSTDALIDFTDPVWNTLGAHDPLMEDNFTDFQKNGAHDPHMEDSK